MKKLRIVLLTVAVILIAAGAAFATNESKDSKNVDMFGYYYDESAPVIKCIATGVPCTTDLGPACTWTDANKVTHELSRYISDTMCGDPLYQRPN